MSHFTYILKFRSQFSNSKWCFAMKRRCRVEIYLGLAKGIKDGAANESNRLGVSLNQKNNLKNQNNIILIEFSKN